MAVPAPNLFLSHAMFERANDQLVRLDIESTARDIAQLITGQTDFGRDGLTVVLFDETAEKARHKPVLSSGELGAEDPQTINWWQMPYGTLVEMYAGDLTEEDLRERFETRLVEIAARTAPGQKLEERALRLGLYGLAGGSAVAAYGFTYNLPASLAVAATIVGGNTVSEKISRRHRNRRLTELEAQTAKSQPFTLERKSS